MPRRWLLRHDPPSLAPRARCLLGRRHAVENPFRRALSTSGRVGAGGVGEFRLRSSELDIYRGYPAGTLSWSRAGLPSASSWMRLAAGALPIIVPSGFASSPLRAMFGWRCATSWDGTRWRWCARAVGLQAALGRRTRRRLWMRLFACRVGGCAFSAAVVRARADRPSGERAGRQPGIDLVSLKSVLCCRGHPRRRSRFR